MAHLTVYEEKYEEVKDFITAYFSIVNKKTFKATRSTLVRAGSLTTLLTVRTSESLPYKTVMDTFTKAMARWLVKTSDGLAYLKGLLYSYENRTLPAFVKRAKNGEAVDDNDKEVKSVEKWFGDVFTSPILQTLHPFMVAASKENFAWISLYPSSDAMMIHHWFLAEFFMVWLPRAPTFLSRAEITSSNIQDSDAFSDFINQGDSFLMTIAIELSALIGADGIGEKTIKSTTVPFGISVETPEDTNDATFKLVLLSKSLTTTNFMLVMVAIACIEMNVKSFTSDRLTKFSNDTTKLGLAVYKFTASTDIVTHTRYGDPAVIVGLNQQLIRAKTTRK